MPESRKFSAGYVKNGIKPFGSFSTSLFLCSASVLVCMQPMYNKNLSPPEHLPFYRKKTYQATRERKIVTSELN
jgi:hypothetical protein